MILPTTTCFYCKETKIMGLFTPGEVNKKHPRCRLCERDRNRVNLIRPGAKPGYGVRGRSY